jgi:hypothetical protein
MTEQEKGQLVDAVITRLKNDGTDVSNANIVSNADGIDYVVAYDKNGQIVRAVPTAIKGDKVGVTGDMNTYTEGGVYSINATGGDNLPIDNQGIISARLVVLVTENGGNKVITQVLNLNNNEGGEGNIYIRAWQNGEWKAWGKLQTNIEVGQVNTLDHFTDNGMYSGVLTNGTPTSVGTFYDTFLLIVINNYAVSIPTGNPQSISQLKYSLGLDGSISVATRKRDQYGYWTEWESIGGGGSAVDTNAIKEIKGNAVASDSLTQSATEDDLSIEFKTLDGLSSGAVTLSAATTEKAGVMSAEDKLKLDASIKNIEVSPEADEVELDLEVTDNMYHVPFPAATTESAGVMTAADKKKLDSLTPGGGGGGGDITATPTEEVIEEIEPTLVSTALRKTPQVLTDSEKGIARENIGAVGFSDLNNAIAEAIVNTLNTAV